MAAAEFTPSSSPHLLISFSSSSSFSSLPFSPTFSSTVQGTANMGKNYMMLWVGGFFSTILLSQFMPAWVYEANISTIDVTCCNLPTGNATGTGVDLALCHDIG